MWFIKCNHKENLMNNVGLIPSSVRSYELKHIAKLGFVLIKALSPHYGSIQVE